jgi:DNA-binding NarL/FixJ family response regulator
MINVLVVERSGVLRLGIRASLEEKAGFAIAAEADALRLLLPAASARADVLLAEPAALDTAGKAELALLRRVRPGMRLVVHDHDRGRARLSCADLRGLDALGYLTRHCSPAELRIAIATAAEGVPYINDPLLALLKDDLFRAANLGRLVLSPDQTGVFRMLALGMDTAGIAAQLDLSAQAVEALKARITARMNGPELDRLTRFAVARGFL